MAWFNKNNPQLIFPCHAGEFCGNIHQNEISNPGRNKQYLSKMRFGKPRSCESGTSKEMEDRGYCGLYLINDSNHKLYENEEFCYTPVELMEPGFEFAYNIREVGRR